MKENQYKGNAKKPAKYPPEIKEEAVRMFLSARPSFKNKEQAGQHVATLLGIGCAKTVCTWVRQAEIDAGERQGITTDEISELRNLRRENAELRRANGILKAASAFFRGRARPATSQIVSFIDMFKKHRECGGLMWRVEPICKVLVTQYGISCSPSGYYAHKMRKPSARSLRDDVLKEKILVIWEDNLSCWGAEKVWHALLNNGEHVARCTVERLMRELRLRGLRRNKGVRTTIAGKNAKSADDLLKRNFHAAAPNRVWVADFTYVSTWEGWCYTAFVTDIFARKVLGFAVSSNMTKKLVADAFKMAVYTRQRECRDDFSDLIHHNDKGSQYTAEGFFELLALHGIRVSIGTVGDSYDNALAETMNGSYKTEMIYNPIMGPWENKEKLELATARWVHWHNTSNISKYNNWHTPEQIEDILYNDGEDVRRDSKRGKA